MKLRNIVGLLAVSGLGLVGCEEGGEQPAEQPAPAVQPPPAEQKPATPPAAEAPKAPEVPPAEICNQLAAAAKANDEAKLGTLIQGGVEALAGEGVKEGFIANWAAATCGEAKVDGDKATVTITVPAGKKTKTEDAPFIKAAEGGWKLDAASYLSKYPVETKGKKGKKAKKAKGGKKGK